jgi:transcriptional regulator with XRE-family HTH domain
MEIFVQRLQDRARELGLSQVDVARLAGLNERRFNHYARGRRQPDLATLVRIASTLKTTPNWLLGVEAGSATGPRQRLEAKLNTTCQTLDDFRLGLAVTLVTALATHEEALVYEPKATKRAKKSR